jgi:hypothetical protein
MITCYERFDERHHCLKRRPPAALIPILTPPLRRFLPCRACRIATEQRRACRVSPSKPRKAARAMFEKSAEEESIADTTPVR